MVGVGLLPLSHFDNGQRNGNDAFTRSTDAGNLFKIGAMVPQQLNGTMMMAEGCQQFFIVVLENGLHRNIRGLC